MHEYALADAVVTAARELARREGLRRVRVIEVTLGELQGLEPDLMEEALRRMLPEGGAELQGAELRLLVEPARLRCRGCAREFGLAEAGAPGAEEREAIHLLPELAHAFLACPGCGSGDFEVRSGRGAGLAAVEGE